MAKHDNTRNQIDHVLIDEIHGSAGGGAAVDSD